MRWVMLSTSSRDDGLTEDDIDRPRLSQMFFETFNGHQRLLWPASDDWVVSQTSPGSSTTPARVVLLGTGHPRKSDSCRQGGRKIYNEVVSKG